MRIVRNEPKPFHYQIIFSSLEQAMKHAKEQSIKQNIRLYTILSRNLFFVDSNGTIREGEIIHSAYEHGEEIPSRAF